MLSVESVPALRVLCLMCLALCYGWLSPSGVLFFPLQHSFLISVKSSRHKWIKEGTFSPLVPLTMTPLLSGIVRRRGCTRKLGVGQRTCEGLLTPQVRGQGGFQSHPHVATLPVACNPLRLAVPSSRGNTGMRLRRRRPSHSWGGENLPVTRY